MTHFTRALALSLLPLLAACPAPLPPAPLPAAPKVLSFTATPGTITQPGKATLSWETQDATQVDLTDGSGAVIAGVDNKLSGSLDVDVATSSLFVLSARNARGVRDSAVATVTLKGGPVGVLLAATPSLINPGESTTLAWSAPGAAVVTIAGASGASLDLKGQVSSGSITVTPDADMTYTLSADGKTATARVSLRPAVIAFTGAPGFVSPGGQVTLTWQTQGATRVVIETPGRGELVNESDPGKVASGTFTDTVPLTTDLAGFVPYVLRADGTTAAGSASRTVTVSVGKVPVVTSFTAPEYARQPGTFQVAWVTTGADRVEVSVAGGVVYQSPSLAAAASGTMQLPTPTAAAEYTLTATSSRGGSASSKKTVTPIGPTAVTSFTATPATVAAGGDAVTLTWNVPNARKLKLSAKDDYTVLTQVGPTAETGTLTVYPNGPTTYLLEADNGTGEKVTSTQAVTVTTPAGLTPTASGPIGLGATIDVGFTVGGGAASIYGLPHTTIGTQAASTGFVDIAATGAKLPFSSGADDEVKTFTPDFETFLYGARLAGAVTVSSNGFLVLGSSALPRATSAALPGTALEPNLLAPYWADLVIGATGGIYWQVLGEAPERKLVVQWDQMLVKGEATSVITVEAVVAQTGVITYEYKTITTTGAAPVIGVQGPPGMGLAHSTGVATAGSVTFFGAKASPATLKMDREGPFVGFVKLGSAYLKISYTAVGFLRPGSLGISEVMYSPAVAIAATGEWFEVYNDTSGPFDLTGWTLDFGGGNTHTIAAIGGTTVVPAHGVLVLGQSADATENGGAGVAYAYGNAFTLADTTGTLTLSSTSYSTSITWTSASAGQGGVGASMVVDPGPFRVSTDLSTTALHPLTCTSTAAFGTASELGTPGLLKGCFGYARSSIAPSYFDISASGAPLFTSGSMDESLATVSLAAAPFSYFGTAQPSVQVSSNGFVAFKTTLTSAAMTNKAVPSTTAPFGMAAIFWDDLNGTATAGSNAYSKRVSAGEDPANPGAHWIVQWHHFTHYSAGDDLNFQVKLFDSGVIEYHFAGMTSGSTSNYANGNSATSWLDSVTGATALAVSINSANIQPNTAFKFTPQ